MEKKLPKVFANKPTKNFDNNKKIYYSSAKIESHDNDKKIINKNINQKINDVFASEKYVYKADVEITTKSGIKKVKLIGQNKTHLITIDNELIPITDLTDIKLI